MGGGAVQEKKRWRGTCAQGASSLKYGGCSKGVPPILQSPTGARQTFPSNRRSPRLYPWRSTLVVIGRPVLRAPLTLPWKREGRGVPNLQTPALSTPRAETFLESDTRSHRESVFSLGPCTARSLFGKTKKRMGGAFPPAKPASSPRRGGAKNPAPLRRSNF
jgi:hypothetical protein